MSDIDRDLMRRTQHLRDYLGWLSIMVIVVVMGVSMWHLLLPTFLHWLPDPLRWTLYGTQFGLALGFFATRLLVMVDREREYP